MIGAVIGTVIGVVVGSLLGVRLALWILDHGVWLCAPCTARVRAAVFRTDPLAATPLAQRPCPGCGHVLVGGSP